MEFGLNKYQAFAQ